MKKSKKCQLLREKGSNLYEGYKPTVVMSHKCYHYIISRYILNKELKSCPTNIRLFSQIVKSVGLKFGDFLSPVSLFVKKLRLFHF